MFSIKTNFKIFLPLLSFLSFALIYPDIVISANLKKIELTNQIYNSSFAPPQRGELVESIGDNV